MVAGGGNVKGNVIPKPHGEEKMIPFTEEENRSPSRVFSANRLNLAKCYEIMFDRCVDTRDRLEREKDDDDDNVDLEDETAEFLKAYCDNRKSFVFGSV